MKKFIDKNTWKRREHFEFFKSFDEPFFGVVTEVDCNIAYQKAKDLGVSFFIYYLHKSIVAANEIKEFRYRLEGNNVVCYDKIHASPTIGRDNGVFGYSFIEYSPDFKQFEISANKEIDAVKNSTGLRLTQDGKRIDTIHYTSLPWFKLYGLSHPRNFKNNDSVPKISFGKMEKEANRKMMSIDIHAHHGLMDGYHVGKYIELFQKLMND